MAISVPVAAAGAVAREENAYTLGVQAVLWGYPMVCQARNGGASVRLGTAGVNTFRWATEPRHGTIDGCAWLDLRDEAVVLHLPALTEPRWYLVQIGDAFDEVAANIGGIKGPRAGAHAITGPDFQGALPGEMTRVRLRTRQCFAAVRLLVAGLTDLAGAIEAQRGFHLTTLSAYLRDGLRHQPAESQTLPAFSDDAPAELRFFEQLGQTMRWYLPVSADRTDLLVKAFHQIGLSAAHGFDWSSLNEDTARGLARAREAAEQIIDARWTEVGETIDGWHTHTAGGRTGHDLALRATLAKHVPGAQLASEVIHARCAVDADHEPLHGRHAYRLHFPAGRTPPVSAFWNLAMHGEENDIGRSGVSSATEGLRADPDGSLTLHIQPDRPEDEAAANWLRAPHAPFELTMGVYGPATRVLDGSYRLPAVTRTRL